MAISTNQILTLAIYEGDVVDVKSDGTMLCTSTIQGMDSPIEVPGLYGGCSDAGIYSGQGGAGVQAGDKVLLCRVHPGSMGVTQAIRVIPGKNRTKNTKEVSPGPGQPSGRTNYPVKTLKDGDIMISGSGGGFVSLSGNIIKNEVFVGNILKSGLYIGCSGKKTGLATVSHTIQSASSGHRLYCGDINRFDGGSNGLSRISSSGHEIGGVSTETVGRTRGILSDSDAAETSFLGGIRNPAISQYRLVINEVSEHSKFKGWDLEAVLRSKPGIGSFSGAKENRAIGPDNILHLQPHQLIEIIGGNVVNNSGDMLDPNYGVLDTGVSEESKVSYEEARLNSRRGIGYHFQMSTNSLSTETSNDVNNFVYAIDKEGSLKVSVPRSSKTGNILYPTSANFYDEGGTVSSEPDGKGINSEEKIPILLRTKGNESALPPSTVITTSPSQRAVTDTARKTGIRFKNDNNYFQGVREVIGGDGKNVRINPTKHHNMYAAAEMLIANMADGIMVPTETSECPGIEMGNPVGEPFERYSVSNDGDGTDPNTEPKFMTVIRVAPGQPAIDTGGGVIAAGADGSASTVQGDDDARINVPYANAFTVGAEGGSDLKEGAKSPGGKSANINFEGAIEVSVGRDDNDQKSILLDTAGALVAWFGADKNNRSLIVQTDGGVLLNVGGANGDVFNKGRFDLRVNVTNKGWLGDDDFTPQGGPHASDYLISISENGLVIAGMKPDTPMIIRNDGNLSIESTAKLILAGQSVEMREGNRPPRKTHKAPESADQEPPTPESVNDDVGCLITLLSDIAD